ncbi:hypothetical protein ACS6JN_22810 [Enterobacter hormaechei subsp. steigerwaltii]|uniref:hypothetical protein n=1 Tax=Enterobacter hormaechei TaxID=158836 RepID=UPI003F438207
MECKVSDLVKRGHDQSAELKESCGAVDVRTVAQLISDLATQLDVQLARSNALAAENAGLIEQAEEVYAAGYNHGHLNTVDGIAYADCVKDDFYGLAVELMREAETPATDAFLAEVRAQGVEMFAERKNNEMMSLHPDTHAVGSIAAEMSSQVKQLRDFAAEVRKGVQS